MRNSFNLLDEIFDICINDEEMLGYLQVDIETQGDDLELLNQKLSREYQTAEVIEPEDCPFISYYFMHSEKSKHNWLVNIGDLYIDIYANSIYDIEKIVTRFRQLMKDMPNKMLLNYEGQHFSGVNNVYKYRLIYNPLVDGE